MSVSDSSSMSPLGTGGNSINLKALVDARNSETNTLARQAQNRMNALIGRIDISGVAGVKVGKDGSYEILAESKNNDADRLKEAVSQAFSEDKTLGSILEKLKSSYQAESAEAAQAPASTDAQPVSQLQMMDWNGDTVEISDESRARMEQLYEKNKHLFEDRSERVILNYTARSDMLVTMNDAPRLDADSAFKAFSGYLLDAAQEEGKYENDFLIGLDGNNNLFVSDVKGIGGGEATDKAESEKSTLTSILDSLNKAMKSGGSEGDSPMVQTLRKFFNASSQYDAVSSTNNYAQNKFPLMLRTSARLW